MKAEFLGKSLVLYAAIAGQLNGFANGAVTNLQNSNSNKVSSSSTGERLDRISRAIGYGRGSDQVNTENTPIVDTIDDQKISLYANTDDNTNSDSQETTEAEDEAQDDDDSAEDDVTYETDVPAKCSKDSFIISSSKDLKAIADCDTLIGNVRITNYEEPFIEFGDIKAISGDLEVTNAPNLVRMEAAQVNLIGGRFILRELTSLTMVSFPSLQSIHTIDWRVLPILSTVHFNQGIKNIHSIIISDTSLTGFSGFSVDKLDIFNINNNRFLETISSNVKQITGSLLIAANAKDVSVDLPLLKSVNNITLHDIASLNLGSLEDIEASASFINNYFHALKLPKLKKIGGTLSISDNNALSQVDFPSVTEIGGGLMVLDNTGIDKINFFPKLAIIGGAIEFAGNIKETSLMKLKLVKGSAIIQSTARSFDCAKWSRSEISSVIRGGRIECTNSDNEKTISTPSISEYNDLNDDSDGTGLQNSTRQQFSFKNFRSSATTLYSLPSTDVWFLGLIITTLTFAAF